MQRGAAAAATTALAAATTSAFPIRSRDKLDVGAVERRRERRAERREAELEAGEREALVGGGARKVGAPRGAAQVGDAQAAVCALRYRLPRVFVWGEVVCWKGLVCGWWAARI